MMESSRVDLGSVQIHKKAIADLTFSALSEVDGVSLIPKNIIGKLKEYLGDRNYPGIVINIEKSGQVTIEVKVCVRYGINIQDIARQIQEVVRTAVERTVDITLKDINVNIHGIERGKQ